MCHKKFHPQLIILENFKENNITENVSQFEFRNFNNFNMDAFERYINAIDRSLATEDIDTNLNFMSFLQLFYRVL